MCKYHIFLTFGCCFGTRILKFITPTDDMAPIMVCVGAFVVGVVTTAICSLEAHALLAFMLIWKSASSIKTQFLEKSIYELLHATTNRNVFGWYLSLLLPRTKK